MYKAFFKPALATHEPGRAVSSDNIAQTTKVAGLVETRKIHDKLIQDSPQHCRPMASRIPAWFSYSAVFGLNALVYKQYFHRSV